MADENMADENMADDTMADETMADETTALDPVWNKPVPDNIDCLDEAQLPPRNHRLSDKWKAVVGAITCKERYARWPQS